VSSNGNDVSDVQDCQAELKLVPLLVSSKVNDVSEYDSGFGTPRGDHVFNTVQVNGKEKILDKFMNVYGDVSFKHGKIVIKQETGYKTKEVITRFYESLEELTVDKYLSMMADHRLPENGRKTLAAGQKLPSYNRQVFVELNEEKNSLVSSIIFNYSF
jgi:hypothetical protein